MFATLRRHVERLEEAVEPHLPLEERTFNIVTEFLDTADDDQKAEVLAAIEKVRAARAPPGEAAAPEAPSVAPSPAQPSTLQPPEQSSPPQPLPQPPAPPPEPQATPAVAEKVGPVWQKSVELWLAQGAPRWPPGANGTGLADYDGFGEG